MSDESRYSPWHAARDMPNVQIHYALLPDATGGAMLARRADTDWIILDPRLSQAERRTALTHELVHLERGSSARCRHTPRAWDVVVAREETIVDREVAARLVPAGELDGIVQVVEGLGEAVTASMVAETFDTTEACAAVALDDLERWRIVQQVRRGA